MPRQAERGLHFINTNPSSARPRSDLIHEIRSHAGRWRWQQVRRDEDADRDEYVDFDSELDQSHHPEHSYVTTTGAIAEENERLNAVELAPLTSDATAVVRMDPRRPTPFNASQSHAIGATNSRIKRQEEPSEESRIAHVSQNHLGYHPRRSTLSRNPHASILDPFHTSVPSPIPIEFISINNKYAVSVLWPGLMPGSTTTGNHAGVNAWFSHSIAHSALHSSMLFGSFSHRRVQVHTKGRGRFSSDDLKQMSLSHEDSISKINDAIQRISNAVTDDIILCVLCLANNDTARYQKADESPFRPPLRSLQWLDIYGSLSPNPIHQQGLIQLVRLRGGLDKIELPGLAAVISFSSILAASRSLSPPYFPIISLKGEALTLQHMLSTQDLILDPSDPLGFFEGTPELQYIFQAVRRYVSLVETYIDGSPTAEDLGTICDRRNLVQWHIMSLIPAGQGLYNASSDMYECCRLALTIFGVGVVFPLPSEIVPLLELSRMLLVEMHSESYRNAAISSVNAQEIHCWCVILGGIAAGRSQERGWFTQELRLWAVSCSIKSWDELLVTLQSVLWFNGACDLAGKDMWIEAMSPVLE